LFLHYLRVSSALIVCLGHSKEFLFVHLDTDAHAFERVIRLFLSLGPSAVLVFFFLSGFLVGGKVISDLLKKELNLASYIFQRLSRLWIVLIPALILTFALNEATCGNYENNLYCTADPSLASHPQLPPLATQKISDFFLNLFFLQPFIGPPWGGNGPLWSLGYEFWYYMVFFCLMMLLQSILLREFTYKLIPILICLFFAYKILNYDWIVLGIVWTSGSFTAYLLKIARIRDYSFKFKNYVPMKFSFLSAFLIMPSLVCLKFYPRIYSFPILISILMFCILSVRSDTTSSMNKKLQNLIVRGSEFSFSLYLIHFPLLAFISSKITPQNRWAFTPQSLILLLGINLGVAVIAYVFALLTEFNLIKVRIELKKLMRMQ
jgi:peptidoglycan/LPS O-acetylase OafA/YrhL